MTNEEKQLLLKSLCARLPYGVKVEIKGLHITDPLIKVLDGGHILGVQRNVLFIKPFLRPLSSMTEEEKKELKEEHKKDVKVYAEVLEKISKGNESARGTAIPHFAADWCNAHHLDYRGLIPMGMALEAPADMYKIK